jgi:dTDP-4-amino-4,6-dideoxygalactose transaminase
MKIPFNRPCFQGNELEYISDAIRSGHISGDGRFTLKCQDFLETRLGVGKALLTSSCTDALEMSALLLDIKPGDEVIVPSFTFVSTINAFVLRGATAVFADIRRDTLNLDERQLESLITPRTKAIVPVHYAGVGCEMDVICEVARSNGVAVVEDNAHGLFGKYKDKYLGTFGALATQSFHETKNITCGEGGALLINDSRLVQRAEILREKGTDRSRFFRGQVDKYTWVDVGSSFLPSDVTAAFLYAQLEASLKIQVARKRIWDRYNSELSSWAFQNGISLPFVPNECEQAYHMFYLIMPSFERRTALIDHLKSAGILSVFHYLPLHRSSMGIKHAGRVAHCPVTDEVSDRLLRLPFFNDLSIEDQDKVIEALKDFSFS